MNRRTFFRGLLAAACTAVARAYVPAALVMRGDGYYQADGVEKLDWSAHGLCVDPMRFTVRFTLRDGTPSPSVQAWLDECGDIVTKHMRAGV